MEWLVPQEAPHPRHREGLDALAAQGEAARGTFELGAALGDLKKPGMSEAAGFTEGFYPMCKGEFDLARTTVDRLLRAVRLVSEARYAELKPARVDALLDLAMATEADDTEAILAEESVALWEGGPTAALKATATEAVIEATKHVRAHLAAKAPTKKVRGRTTTPKERAAAEKATKTLRKRGSKATVKVRATKPGAPSAFDVVGLTEAEVAELLSRQADRRFNGGRLWHEIARDYRRSIPRHPRPDAAARSSWESSLEGPFRRLASPSGRNPCCVWSAR